MHWKRDTNRSTGKKDKKLEVFRHIQRTENTKKGKGIHSHISILGAVEFWMHGTGGGKGSAGRIIRREVISDAKAIEREEGKKRADERQRGNRNRETKRDDDVSVAFFAARASPL